MPGSTFYLVSLILSISIGMTASVSCAADEWDAQNNSLATSPRSPVDRLRHEGIRAKSRGDVEKMEAAGFNLVLPWKQILEGARKSSQPDSDTILHPDEFSEEAVWNSLRKVGARQVCYSAHEERRRCRRNQRNASVAGTVMTFG